MTRTTAVTFRRMFGVFRHEAQRGPVEITRHGRRDLVLMSAEQYDWLVAAARRKHRTAEVMPFVADAVRRADTNPEHVGLDKLSNARIQSHQVDEDCGGTKTLWTSPNRFRKPPGGGRRR